MPASETPTNPIVAEPPPLPQGWLAAVLAEKEKAARGIAAVALEDAPEPTDQEREEAPIVLGRSTSRYVDYDTHELLEKISEYEDQQRWQRIREGIWISILAHIVFFSLLYYVPRYVFHQTQVIDPFDAIKQRKDLTYLDELPDALKEIQKAKPKLPPLRPNQTTVDKKTLDALKALEKAKAALPAPEPKQGEPTPPPQPVDPQVQQPVQQQAQTPPSVAAPQPNPQVALDTPRPAPVPARPNFAVTPQSATDSMRQAMRGSAHSQDDVTPLPQSHLNLHPGSGSGGVQVLTDLQGVNFDNWLLRWHRETQTTWDPLIPEEANPPISKRGTTVIRFKIMPNGRVMPGSMVLEGGTTADTALSRAAWGAITNSNYPPLPREFHGPFIELRAFFLYNMEQQR